MGCRLRGLESRVILNKVELSGGDCAVVDLVVTADRCVEVRLVDMCR